MVVSQDIPAAQSAIPAEALAGELDKLRQLSARLGRDPLLVQASSGNTSIKTGDTLWIKASGKWLARAAEDDIFVPVDLPLVRESLTRNGGGCMYGTSREGGLQPSIETAMHAVLPHRVVIHVHSVATLAWAVRLDGPERLAERLAGIDWQWIPYVSSGLPLARAVELAVGSAPGTSVFVLANHGLVICGQDCESAEALLRLVEDCLAVPPRETAGCDPTLSDEIAALPEWRLPETERIHALSTDEVSLAILKAGVLYPCQAMFLGTSLPMLPASATFARAIERCEGSTEVPPFWIIERRGLVIGKEMTTAQLAILRGLVEVVQRIDASASLRYIEDGELTTLLNEDSHCYRRSAESNATVSEPNAFSQHPRGRHDKRACEQEKYGTRSGERNV